MQKTLVDSQEIGPKCNFTIIFTIIVLSLSNILSYIDKNVGNVLKQMIIKDLNITDFESSLPLTGFNTLSVLTGLLGGALIKSHISRKFIMSFSVLFWSICTMSAYYSINYLIYLICRSTLGIGETLYQIVSVPFIAGIVHPDYRARALATMTLCALLGAAGGAALGGYLGEHYGWRETFLFCGIPGIPLALLVCCIKDPGPEFYKKDDLNENVEGLKQIELNFSQKINYLIRNQDFMIVLSSTICLFFALGIINDWESAYLIRQYNITPTVLGFTLAPISIVCGISGVVVGSFLVDIGGKRLINYNAHFIVGGVATLFSGTANVFAIFFANDFKIYVLFKGISIFFNSLYGGSITATLIGTIDNPKVRVLGLGIFTSLTHLLGDMVSPPIVGLISDKTGNLRLAMGLLPISLFMSSVIMLFAIKKKNKDNYQLIKTNAINTSM